MASPNSLYRQTEGDEPSAAQERAKVDLLKRRPTQPGMFSDGTGNFQRGVRAEWNHTTIDVRNKSGSDQPKCGVLGISVPSPDPADGPGQEAQFADEPAVDGVLPDKSKHLGKWCVLTGPVRDGSSVRACVAGVTAARVYVNNFGDKFCDVIDAETVEGDPEADPPTEDETCYLGSGSSGAQILWWAATSETDNDTIVWALVRLGGGGGIVRVKLLDDLYQCGSAQANILIFPTGSGSGSGSGMGDVCCDQATLGDVVTIRDQLGVVASSALAYDVDFSPNGFIPAGCYADVRYFADRQQWEPLAFGESVCGSGSGSGSGSGGSGSGGSGSGGSGSGASGSGASGSGTGKSTAIVPASWTRGGYTALFVAECPDVRFDDVMVVAVKEPEERVLIDPHYLEVCEPDSISVCGCVPDLPVLVGACVAGKEIIVRSGDHDGRIVEVTIRLTGIRRDFAGLRFPDKTPADFAANEKFLKGAFSQ